jgi:hypothetical protein
MTALAATRTRISSLTVVRTPVISASSRKSATSRSNRERASSGSAV